MRAQVLKAFLNSLSGYRRAPSEVGRNFGIEGDNLPNTRERELETRSWLDWNVSQEVAPVDDLNHH